MPREASACLESFKCNSSSFLLGAFHLDTDPIKEQLAVSLPSS